MEELFADSETKERINFTKAETERLQSLITKHKSILLCKKTDGTSTKQKEKAWSTIHYEFNALGTVPRSIKQLKYKFENLKRAAKKGASKERQEMRRTGGGPPPPPPDSGDATDWLRSIMPTSVDGNPAIYDDDDLSLTHLYSKPIKRVEDTITSESPEHNNGSMEFPVVDQIPAFELMHEFDASAPHSSLKKRVSSPLKDRMKKAKATEEKKKREEEEEYKRVRHMLREKKISAIDNLQELEIKKIKDSIRHAQEIHDQKLRHNEIRHQLEKEKLNLEITLLKKSLE